MTHEEPETTNLEEQKPVIRVADYIARTVADHGLSQVFLVTGGGAMFLNHAFANENRLRCVYNHHEQASAMAAEGYARVAGIPAVVNVTTGPGGINALNGIFGAWTDSIPMLVIAGQVKRETCLASYHLPRLRQLGDQEVDIVRMAQGITKYAAYVENPQTIRYHLERALYLAINGRPGPCLLDIPLDVQAAQVAPEDLEPYDNSRDKLLWDLPALENQCLETLERIDRSSRPVIMAGTGVRIAGAVEEFQNVIDQLRIPVTTAWTAHDLIATDHPLYCGRPGTLGDRPGNFAVQNSDLLLVIGSRLNVRQVGYAWKTFARWAFKIQVDVDGAELTKPNVKLDLPVHSDAKIFLDLLLRCLRKNPPHPRQHAAWLDWCRERWQRYRVKPSPSIQTGSAVSPYDFFDSLFQELNSNDIIVCANGSACVIPFQIASIKKGQRLFCNSGCASMGYDLPAAIGAAFAAGGKRVICLAGDGSVQMNIQELQTVAHHRLPLKIFILNNSGYLSIRQTQMNFFGSCAGEGPNSGVTFPNMVRIARAYKIPAWKLAPTSWRHCIQMALARPGPTLVDVELDPNQLFEPKAGSRQLPNGRIVSPPLEDMAPYLSRDELRENLLIPELTYA